MIDILINGITYFVAYLAVAGIIFSVLRIAFNAVYGMFRSLAFLIDAIMLDGRHYQESLRKRKIRKAKKKAYKEAKRKGETF